MRRRKSGGAADCATGGVGAGGLGLLETQLACGIAAALGHCYPLFHGFRGGKGAGTLFGAAGPVSWGRPRGARTGAGADERPRLCRPRHGGRRSGLRAGAGCCTRPAARYCCWQWAPACCSPTPIAAIWRGCGPATSTAERARVLGRWLSGR
ncbi:MAG: glycerol-3-phosphate acyltransferase [Lysobacterales bacterium]